jgi:hypothetical protein
LLLASFTTTPVFALTYIVDGGGGGDYTSIQACADAALEGDVCEVKNGNYSGFSPRSGQPNNPIKFVASSGHSPVVAGDINVHRVSNVTIQGLRINGGISSRPTTSSFCNNIKILDNYIYDTSIGINIKGYDILISGNTFDNMSNDMIRHFGNRWTIRNNIAIDERDSTDEHMDFWQSFCAPDDSSGIGAQYGLIENNSMINVSGGNVHFALVNDTDDCEYPPKNLIFRYNKIHNIGSLGIYIDDNDQAPGSTKSVVYNNSFSMLNNGSFSWHDASCNLEVSTHSSAINNLHDTAMRTSNAIGFYFASSGYQAHNLYYSRNGTMSFSKGASKETGAVKNENPLLNNPDDNDFSLGEFSPAINKGGALTHVAASDSGSGNILIVEKSEFFQPGWGGANPDMIAVGNVNNAVLITSIDYDTNTITLENSISRSGGDPVFLYKDSDGTRVLYGSAPDIGAVESQDMELAPPSPPVLSL